MREGRSDVALNLVDASALLWRLTLAGCDVGNRWAELAQSWDKHADDKLYAFNDWHASMAYLGAGRHADVDRQTRSLKEAKGAETAKWAHSTVLPLIEGFAAYWRGDHAEAVEKLHSARFIANGFGGSHAQRDIIDCTLTESALRGGFRDISSALAHERLAVRPHSPVNQRYLTQSAGLGLQTKAA